MVVLQILSQLCQRGGHCFWSEDISLRSMLRPGTAITHTQITDVYLLGLAIHKEGKLATFDQNIPATILEGGSDALEKILP